jgi:hypothetical protein
MNPEQIEKSIKRLLSDAENIAVSRLRRELPADRRKQEKILGRARKKARMVELGLRERIDGQG